MRIARWRNTRAPCGLHAGLTSHVRSKVSALSEQRAGVTLDAGLLSRFLSKWLIIAARNGVYSAALAGVISE